MKTIYEVCEPRDDVLAGIGADQDFAADLASVVRNDARAVYGDATQFFANTYPTKGLKELLASVCRRVSGAEEAPASIMRLDTSYGGGKTHGLIALVHATRGMHNVENVDEFIDPVLLPTQDVRVSAFTGENADPANGRKMGTGSNAIRARTPWGEIAYELGGHAGFTSMKESDEKGMAPGAENLRALFQNQPALILLDELSIYLRKVFNQKHGKDQFEAFLSSLIQAVESAPKVALVYTLAIGSDGKAQDAYVQENQFIADVMDNLTKVSARKATLLNPTEVEEYPLVLRRRLFSDVDESAVDDIVNRYQNKWRQHQDELDSRADRVETIEHFRKSYPFHPEVLDTLTEKTFTLANFQRIRGMLRLLGRTVKHVWEHHPLDAYAIHLHHMDPGLTTFQSEFVTRLERQDLLPAITTDISGSEGNLALAERLEEKSPPGTPPYAPYVARTIFLHTLAFNVPLQGISPERLRYAVVSPETEPTLIEEARRAFVEESAYLDDRSDVPMRYISQPNINKIIQQEEQNVDAIKVIDQLNAHIQSIFSGKSLDLVPFPGAPYDVPDEIGNNKPRLVVIHYDADSVKLDIDRCPRLVRDIYKNQGISGKTPRKLRNHLVFLMASSHRIDAMKQSMRRRLALIQLTQSERINEFAEHQQNKLRELWQGSEQLLATSIQQCYRHVFYASTAKMAKEQEQIAHTSLDDPNSSNKPGLGQDQIVRTLRELNKLRLPEDEPDNPKFVRDQTPLKKGEMNMLALRSEFRENPALPMLIEDNVFMRGIEAGIQSQDFIYRCEGLLYGPGDPTTTLEISQAASILTMARAQELQIWPRTEAEEDEEDEGEEDSGQEPQIPTRIDSETIEIHAEGPIGQALQSVWAQAEAQKLTRVHELTLKAFGDYGTGLQLLSLVGNISKAEKSCSLRASYITNDESELSLEFSGSFREAEFAREFLLQQMKSASDQTFEGIYTLTYADGLELTTDAIEEITNKLTHFSSIHVALHSIYRRKPGTID